MTQTHGFDPDAAPTSTVDFGKTRDGLTQLRRRWPVESPAAAVVIAHGVAEHSGRYEHVGRQLADAGLFTVGYDHRGFGQSGGARAYVDRFSQYHDDLEDQLEQVRDLDVPVVLLGHSMGGLIAASYVLDGRPTPDLLVLSAPAIGAEAPAWMRRSVGTAARLLPKVRLKPPFDSSGLTRDPRVNEAYDADPLVELPMSTRLGAELLSTVDWTRERIDQLALPTLLLHGGDDTIVPTASSEIAGENPVVDRRVIDGSMHEIFNEPEGPEAVATVIAWIRDQI